MKPSPSNGAHPLQSNRRDRRAEQPIRRIGHRSFVVEMVQGRMLRHRGGDAVYNREFEAGRVYIFSNLLALHCFYG